ncbi:alcohol dehydrogenase [Enterococcus sp. JM4C]|uniref:zinc-binding alcohol dehydrogenase family protein n=1 Tax=Candidatus Enterococcus huntleyi TaxID=1857217 RepID=UPI00137A6C23|nr:zinc-binding alcohol dehydrogenase family protein [Enterococcus sp. JM4C]KAF1298683.1 alcohol dehydrogenase [Enterococcus sp. JM4C]
MKTRAIAFKEGFALLEGNQFEEIEWTLDELTPQDVLVKIEAISVNPVDTKLRQTFAANQWKILGFDAVGKIINVGTDVSDFSIGDRVMYSGTNKRAGSYAEHQVVDSRLIAKVPEAISSEKAAALPLTSLTAFEVLFEKMGLQAKEKANLDETILIVNGAGGVGSVAIQLAKWVGLNVLATASRSETSEWIKQMGADISLNHRKDLVEQMKQLNLTEIRRILLLHSTDFYYEPMAKFLAPFGHLASIVEAKEPVNLSILKNKSASFDWEYMFAKTDYDYQIESQGIILEKIAELLAAGKLTSTHTETLQGLTPETIFEAHRRLETNRTIGKLVITVN